MNPLPPPRLRRFAWLISTRNTLRSRTPLSSAKSERSGLWACTLRHSQCDVVVSNHSSARLTNGPPSETFYILDGAGPDGSLIASRANRIAGRLRESALWVSAFGTTGPQVAIDPRRVCL